TTSNLLNSSSPMMRRARSRGKRAKQSVEQAMNTAVSVLCEGMEPKRQGTIAKTRRHARASGRFEVVYRSWIRQNSEPRRDSNGRLLSRSEFWRIQLRGETEMNYERATLSWQSRRDCGT